MMHKIVHKGIPEELATRMPLNVRNPCLVEVYKLDTKPKFLMKNKPMRLSFRNCSYIFNTLPNRLTSIADPKRFNKWLKIFLMDPTKLPKLIPTKTDPKPIPNQTKTSRRQPKARKGAHLQPNQTVASQGASPSQIDEITALPPQFHGLAQPN